MNDRWGDRPSANRPEQSPYGPVEPWHSQSSQKKPPWDPNRRRRRRRWIARILIVVAFLAGIALVATAVDRGIDWVRARSGTTTTEKAQVPTARVVIEPGMTATEIGKLLEEEGVIESSAAFVELVNSRGTGGKLRPGTYQFPLDQGLITIVDDLEQGRGSSTIRLTIPEGLADSQVAELLTEEGTIDGDSYLELSGQPDKFIVPQVGGSAPKVKTLEGLLFPSTYFLLLGDGATELIGAQLAAFEAKTSSLPWENAENLGMTPYEIVIVASLIEKEARIADERPKVAAVIYNRLKEDMTLGIDATVRYALNKWTGSLTTEDLDVDSAFNTRKVKGLPPAPISNPGVAALQAALEPAEEDYLYYVLSDTEGHHFFTASYEEFLKAKENAPSQ